MIKDLDLRVDGLNVRGQLYLPENVEPPFLAVILSHGVPSGTVDPTDGGYPLLAKTICEKGFAVYTFRFRGTGESQGNFDVLGWTRDLIAAIDAVYQQPEIDKKRLGLVGFSAGAAVSLFVTAHDLRITAVAACASPADFSSISESPNPQITLHYFRKVGIIRDPGFPPSVEEWLAGFRTVNALKAIPAISPRPVLLVHASQDPVVPLSNSERLYEAAGEPRQMIVIEGSEHRLRRNELVVDTLVSWLKAHLN
jgi:dipeptidyl aminopeptidase/acylaminoacyl peptidase